MLCSFRNVLLPTWQSAQVSDLCAKTPKWKRGPLLGAGAYGIVSLAVGIEQGQLFAVKSVEAEGQLWSKDKRKASCLNALQREKEFLKHIDSPRVIQCLGEDWSIENGITHHNVFLEYMPGRSLADYGKKTGGKLEEPLLQWCTMEILEGLQYLHARGIVHCDIKGRNILLGMNGAKIADFGAAMHVSETAASRCGGPFSEGTGSCWHEANGIRCDLRGSAFWMAPEAVTSKLPQGTARDIWSLGCTIIELAVGGCPWGNEVDPVIVLSILSRQDSTPPIPNTLSLIAQDFIAKCLVINPSERWTAEQLLSHPFISMIRPSGMEPLPPPQVHLSPPPLAAIPSTLTCHENSVNSEFVQGCNIKDQPPQVYVPDSVRRYDGDVKDSVEVDPVRVGDYLNGPEETRQPQRQVHDWELSPNKGGRVTKPARLEISHYQNSDSEATPRLCLSPWRTQSWGFGGVQDGKWFVVYPKRREPLWTIPQSSTVGMNWELQDSTRPKLLRALSTSRVPDRSPPLFPPDNEMELVG